MRKSSYLFLAMAFSTPFVTAWIVHREAAQYKARFGVDAEGMGFFAMVASGAGVCLVLFLVAAVCATRAYLEVEKPRSSLRNIELGLFWLAPVLVVLFVYFGMLGGPYDPPRREE